jgi:hypothetical protein
MPFFVSVSRDRDTRHEHAVGAKYVKENEK